MKNLNEASYIIEIEIDRHISKYIRNVLKACIEKVFKRFRMSNWVLLIAPIVK